jgi:FAD/FMN-containing dehydrogenase
MKKWAQKLETTVVANALAMDGSCSGEHGIGIHKLVQSTATLLISGIRQS